MYSCFNSKKITTGENVLKPEGSDIVLPIDFQDFFVKDTVSLIVENTLVFKEKILTSNQISGLTEVSLFITSNANKYMVIDRLKMDTLTYLNLKPERISLEIMINHTHRNFIVEPIKGKYFGLYKKNSSVEFLQSKIPFEYN